jgi:hypothetical protein
MPVTEPAFIMPPDNRGQNLASKGAINTYFISEAHKAFGITSLYCHLKIYKKKE